MSETVRRCRMCGDWFEPALGCHTCEIVEANDQAMKSWIASYYRSRA